MRTTKTNTGRKRSKVKVKGGQTGDETRQESLAAEESGLFNSSDDAIITEQHPGCHTLPRLWTWRSLNPSLPYAHTLYLVLPSFFIRFRTVFLCFLACFHTLPLFPLLHSIGILIVFLISYCTSLWTWHFSCFVIHYQWCCSLGSRGELDCAKIHVFLSSSLLVLKQHSSQIVGLCVVPVLVFDLDMMQNSVKCYRSKLKLK